MKRPYDESASLQAYLFQHERDMLLPTERAYDDYLESCLNSHLADKERPLRDAVYTEVREKFRTLVAERVTREHPEFSPNRCPQCNAIALTSKAQQCFICGHDWHNRKTTPGPRPQ